MSITRHKSVDSLAIYQRVQSDEKLSMGISLTYSLLHPEEPIMLRNNMELEGTSSTSRQNQDTPVIESPPPNSECISLVPLESAITLYTPPKCGCW